MYDMKNILITFIRVSIVFTPIILLFMQAAKNGDWLNSLVEKNKDT